MPRTRPATIRVNRAPVLTLWAAVVAERLGHAPDTALSLASAVAGTAAHAKARRLGSAEESDPAEAGTARLLGHAIPIVRDAAGTILAEGGGRPAPAAPVRAYVARTFGARLGDVRAAMEALAAPYAPDVLNRIGFGLYELFRPEVPADLRGWGGKGELELRRIREAGPLED